MEAMVSAARRAEIEAHVEFCRDQAAGSLIELGRWLLAAKNEGVVPSGEWTAWLRDHAGVNDRTAQRLMRVAREIPQGSPMERLGTTKLEALMLLPAEDREMAANMMGAEDLSTREVRARVDGLLGREKALDAGEALRIAKAAKEARAKAEQELESQMREMNRRAERLESANALQVQKLADQRTLIQTLTAQAEEARNAREDALRKLGEARQSREDAKQLRARLAQAEAENDRLAEQLDRARLEAAGEEGSAATRILSAIGGMIAMCGQDPARIRSDPGLLSGDDRDLIAGKLAVVRSWCQAMEEAISWVM